MKILKNYLYNMAYQVLSVLIPFVTTPYVSRVLGVEGVGRYSIANTYVNYFLLIGMIGINVFGNRQISYVRDDKQNLEQTFWDINALRIVTMGGTTIIYLVAIGFWFPHEMRWLYLAELFLLLGSMVDISWFFEGLEQFKVIALRNIVIKVTGVVLIFLFVKEQNDIIIYAGILSATTFLGQLLLWKELFKNISYKKAKWVNVKKYIPATIKLWLPTIAIKVYSTLDKVLLDLLTNDQQVGLYTSSQNIVTLVTTITSTLATVTLPRTSNYFKNNNIEELKKLSRVSFEMVSFIAIPMTFGLMGISKSLVPWFFGDGYEDVSRLLLISAWFILTVSWSNIFGNQILLACGKEKIYTIAVSIGAIENIFLSVILIYKWQAAGAIAASILAEYTGMFIMMYNVKGYIDFRKAVFSVGKYFVISIGMLLIIYPLSNIITNSLVCTCIQGVLGVTFYFGFLWIMKDKNMLEVIKYAKTLRVSKD